MVIIANVTTAQVDIPGLQELAAKVQELADNLLRGNAAPPMSTATFQPSIDALNSIWAKVSEVEMRFVDRLRDTASALLDSALKLKISDLENAFHIGNVGGMATDLLNLGLSVLGGQGAQLPAVPGQPSRWSAQQSSALQGAADESVRTASAITNGLPQRRQTPASQLPLVAESGAAAYPTISNRMNNSGFVGDHLADNPTASPLLAGVSAQEWRHRLATFKPGDPLPDPRTPTGDHAIDTLAHAAGQQNTTYAWGGNKSTDGPSRGTLNMDGGGGARLNADDQRVGYDCGGLVRYAVAQGAGFDTGMGTDAIDVNRNFDRIGQGAVRADSIRHGARPGDVLVFDGPAGFSGRGTHHTGIYIGNGYMIDAPESGQPVRVDPVTTGRSTDVLRVR